MIAVVSRQCEANMHLHCKDSGCGCQVCHNTCGICGQPCRSVYRTADSELLAEGLRDKVACAVCYQATKSVVPRVGCESCGGPKGYRDPGSLDGQYLCLECRRESNTKHENRVW
jgi:hypothetical protein